MPLTSRDVLLVLRARDEASQIIGTVGRNLGGLGSQAYVAGQHMVAAGGLLTGVGASMMAAGGGLLALAKDFVDAAVDYRQQAALAATQVEEFGASIESLEEIGFRVAKAIPLPLEQMQQGLYDIFSSTDFTVREAEVLLEGLARAAVAGATDISTAGQNVIGILNAWQLPAEEVTRIMDIQFQMVRRGVGTYAEFANSIGLAVPAAVRAGQTIETLSGMMAFLTRNNLSTSSAAAAAGRALETLAHPTVVGRLEAMGVNVRDAAGEFLPLSVIVRQLSDTLGVMTAPDRAAALQNLFKGAGNSVQARRFWDLAISNADDFIGHVQAMEDSAGSLDYAYDIMFEQPLSQMQLLRNNWDILKVQLGQAIIPLLSQLVDVGLRVVDWFQDLSPETKKFIGQAIAIGGALMVAVGAVSSLAGAGLMIGGFIKMMGGFASVAAMGLKFFGVIGLIAGAAYLIYKNWDTVGPIVAHVWDTMKEKGQQFYNWLVETWTKLWPEIQNAAKVTWDWLAQTWADLWPYIRSAAEATWNWLQKTWTKMWPNIRDAAAEVWDILLEFVPQALAVIQDFADYLIDNFGPGVVQVWETIKEHAWPIIQGIYTIMYETGSRIKAFWEPFWNAISNNWGTIWNHIKDVVRFAADIVSALWGGMMAIISGGIEIIRGVVDVIAGILTGDWGRAWDGAKQIVEGAWTIISGIVTAGWETIKAIFTTGIEALGSLVEMMYQVGVDLMQGLWDGVVEIFDGVISWFGDLPGKIIDLVKKLFGISSPSTVFMQIGRDIMNGLLNGAKAVLESVLRWFTALPGAILGAVGYVGDLLWQKGKELLEGFQRGVDIVWNAFKSFFSNLGNNIWTLVGGLGMILWDKGRALLTGLRSGAEFVWNTFSGWVAGIGGRIVDAVGDLSGLLYGVGRDIMNSLWNGMKDVWGGVKDWVGGLGGIIKGLKGPPEYDKVMLLDNGRLIMQGLQRGMAREWNNIANWLSGLDAGVHLNADSFMSGYGGFGARPVEAGTTVNVAQGAVQITVGSVRDQSDIDRIRDIVDDALADILRQSSQPIYRRIP